MCACIANLGCSEAELSVIVVDAAAVRDTSAVNLGVMHSASNWERIRARIRVNIGYITIIHTNVVCNAVSSIANAEELVVEISRVLV